MAERPLLIIGGSVRAAAWSALRAGFSPICIDAFADADLRACANVLPAPRYPHDALKAVSGLPAGIPWIYTGGLENSPRRIDAISRRHRLLGNSGAVVRSARGPAGLADGLDRHDACLRVAETWAGRTPPAMDGSWMLKPRRGSGGRGVVIWDAGAERHPTRNEPHTFQRRIEGLPVSALFLATEHATRSVGFCRQWSGEADCGAAGFLYAGSIGPIELPKRFHDAAQRGGDVWRRRHGLRGLFGVDFQFDGETLWATEINPRYTASVELYEFARGESLLAEHAAACGWPHESCASPAVLSMAAAACAGKAVIYAPRSMTAPALPVPRFTGQIPALADIPAPGSLIPAGTPICTAYASGTDAEDCERALRRVVKSWRSLWFAENADAAALETP